MKRVMGLLDKRTVELEDAELFKFLNDKSIDCAQRLRFAPCVAHFAMTFADLYALVLKEDPPRDRYQELVNAHASEDEDHWKWFLADLSKLDADPMLRFSDALRFVWSDATVRMRLLSYQMCRLGFQADSLQKLVLVHCIESVGKVTVKHVSAVGQEYTAKTGKKLVYFGKYHSDSEEDHTLEDEKVHSSVLDIHLDDVTAEKYCRMVDESFGYFRAFLDEMLAFAKSNRSVAPAA